MGPPSKAIGRSAFSLQTDIRRLFGKQCMCHKKLRGTCQQAEGNSSVEEEVSVLPREQNHVAVVNHLLMFVPPVLEGIGTLFDLDTGFIAVPLRPSMIDHTCIDVELQSVCRKGKKLNLKFL